MVKALQAQVLRYDAFMAREPFATARAQWVPRLAYYRHERGLRDAELAVAYVV